ncbi:16S rRNA (cytidine(1402)-2'-O)-methyltransferase [Zavarzinia sp. CC-PAN008]|uniref:16S rRNA (cytidine(1402)-2'-O)-methyltransferase n=1 Tax=Zavarzinia sp. CC-PAN008 TaxID=3243332 RepID=UPI003F748233
MRRDATPGLYVVATPIGNARDITMRALDLLAAADVIACEDTRVTARLLAIHGIQVPTLPYHEHNAAAMRPRLLERLAQGQVVALVSDAGTPLISDPGYRLVREVVAAGHAVTTLPGASSVMAALALAALPTDRFLFAGFLPNRSAACRTALAELAPVRASLVLFEAANRVERLLEDALAVLGDRQAAVTRELTKTFEEVRRGALSDLLAYYRAEGPPRGEVVVVIGPDESDAPAVDAAGLDIALADALARMGVAEAARMVAEATGLPRRQVYQRALALKGDADGDA